MRYFIVSSAVNLDLIPTNSQDVYVSLRTFNSSFFDIKKLITEAQRVLKTGALLIISVANGFLCASLKKILPGLILPGTEFIDIYRGLDLAKLLALELNTVGFKNVQISPTLTEIYIAATA